MTSTDCDSAPQDVLPPQRTDAERKAPRSPLSRPAGLLVAVTAAACVTTAFLHLTMVFLHVAPPNVVSQRYQQRINSWIYPYFEQNWQLFAPNPDSTGQHVWARGATTTPDGTRHPGRWLDLSAEDIASVRHDAFPSHTAQNMLRRAWSLYAAVETPGDRPASDRAEMLQRYLTNIARQRLAAHGSRAVDAVQLRIVTAAVPPPSPHRTGRAAVRTASVSRDLPWWKVTTDDD